MSKSSVVQDLMLDVRKILADWLHERLTAVNASYWNGLVVPKLSFQQRAMVESRRYTSLANLDFAGLLRVFDKNWFDLDYNAKLNPQMRAYLKELMIVRNRYAHQSEEVEDDEYLRDIDTLYRFAKGIGSPQELLSAIRDAAGVHEDEIGDEDAQPEVKEDPVQLDAGTLTFKVGEIVRLKSSPEIAGAVVAVSGDEVSVFANGEVVPFFSDQLERNVPRVEKFFALPQAKNNLTSFLIRHPSIPSLYSLNAARIDVIPYQFKPVMKLIRSDMPRLLIADSVGIGKTIEAGLILRELQIRNDIKSVLIICPKPLVTERKWELEMKRFDEEFDPLDSSKLNYCIAECQREGCWPAKYSKAILPFSVCDEGVLKKLGELDPFPKFDLVIVDEAHHIRNPQSLRHQVVREFCEAATAIVFLTATPLQMGETDLYVLLNLLRPDLVPDWATFNTMHSPNASINAALRAVRRGDYEEAKRELAAAGRTEGAAFVVEHPDYEQALKYLNEGDHSPERVTALLNGIGRLHTFNGLINRTVRKEIASEFAVRHPETVRSKMTPLERAVYEGVLNLRRKILDALHGNVNASFMMSMLERQSASCIHGLVPFIRSVVSRSLLSTDSDDDAAIELGQELLQQFTEELDAVCRLADDLPLDDPKYDEFFKVISEKQTLENKKVIVFSTFRHTLSYLQKRLLSSGVRVGLIHGGVDDAERQNIRGRFEKEQCDTDALDVLLFSDVGCEGLDYQFCDTMINYDLPWNPMKIEQRIGRIDRFGQKSAAVAIYNMVVDDTVDARIYDRCLQRINVFESSIGSCDSILGEVHTSIRKVAEATTLTPTQQEAQLEQIALNSVNRLREQSELEERQAELFSIPAKFSAAKEMASLENYWLSPDSLRRLVTSYIRQRTTTEVPITGVDARRQLRLSQEARMALLDDFKKIPFKKGRVYRDWEDYLKGDRPYCTITFDTALACKDKNVQFVMPLHPLVQQAAAYYKTDMPVKTCLNVVDEEVPEGEYPFMIYDWEYKGISNSVQLRAFSTDDKVQERILGYLEAGAAIADRTVQGDPFVALKSKVREVWQRDKEEHCANVKRWTDYKIHSLNISSDAQKRVAQAKKVDNIREGELRRIEARRVQTIEELQRGQAAADVIVKRIVSGFIKIVH
jgi:ERCC4-related helicase